MQTAPVCRLPDDILREIFRHGAECNHRKHHLQFQKVVSRVCTRFRRVALEDALLWSKVKYVPNEKNMSVRKCIELSRSALLDITFNSKKRRLSDKPEYEEFFSLVNKECFRWRSIEIIIPINWLHICTPLCDRNADTRRLVHIALVCTYPTAFGSNDSGLELLPGVYTALREVKLGIFLPSWNWTLRSVTRLELGPFHPSVPNRHPPSYKSLFQMLKCLEPTLEHFTFRGVLGDSSHEETAIGTLHFKSLKKLTFPMFGEDAYKLLAACSFERVQNVDLQLNHKLRLERFHSIFHRPNSALFSTAQYLRLEFIRMKVAEIGRIIEGAFPNITEVQIFHNLAFGDISFGFLTNAWPSISLLQLREAELSTLRALLEARRQRGHPRLRKVELEIARGSLLKSDFDRISSEVEELTIKTAGPKWERCTALPKFKLVMLKTSNL
ncbi:hypothetical protein FRB91_009034 [Serendipita sp. 411]|nr:hypothetical protein FRC15_009508 [Serendipita sp. 397]KAG8802441.1 hypothetical protein FRC16_009630 [Serendipita sp. 398]KAG8825939.1 hypothetical protein FRC19_010116 [Serendipita sp. 401]KAG8838122.1 hypothetical protein FRC18_006155 [Serendipita sp. 400]KAG8858902.1 hypothetical protein FRB91_009034 [Serendipita sp. 411]KAG8872016.1 hypothetical protein FRC20_009915 [Serendipita sp. 405]KAG9056722.1 hypothetical protein FS842_009814 [Serendipita sp. 407]